jgi:hypothetical protein
MNITKGFLVVLFSYIVVACGGGGGGGADPPPQSSTLSGVVAVSAPIANGAIQVKCAGGNPLNTTTNSSGTWQITISGQTPPCAVEISGGTVNRISNTLSYHSVATSFGTVNVTPLTDLALANLVGTATPDIWFASLASNELALITSTLIDVALSNQCAALYGLTPLCSTNPITTAFSPVSGDSMYKMLSALQIAMQDTGITYASLLSDASAVNYAAPAVSFNTALTNAYTNTTTISATANTTAQSLTVGTAMTAFSPLVASDGFPPYTYSYTGTLPTGLSLNTSTGVVSGTPTATYTTADVVFSVEDAHNVVASTTSTVSFTVGPAAVNISAIANTTSQNLTVGTPMASFSPLLPSGGTLPYTFSYTGTLPAGLSFDITTGAVTGTPTAYYASANLVFSVQDANSVVASTTSTVSFSVSNWRTTGSMVTARGSHTATMLDDGTVLIAGGTNGTALSSAELYDPVTGLFSASGTMGEARMQHTATLLPNGKVLVTGGIGTGVFASAELYDPATGLFTATGSMATARANHTATLLPNGKVLVIGGTPNLVTGLASAELYDPDTGLFTATGSMTAARTQHSATLLGNGKVLVTGGAVTASAELYDPATEEFTTTGSMTIARTSHTATLLADGKVLVVGGLGGLASAELYDPATDLFTATGSMVTEVARFAHTATLLSNDKVLVAGGTANGATGTASAELYDPITGSFTATGSMATARVLYTATLLSGSEVLVVGGAGAELYHQ